MNLNIITPTDAVTTLQDVCADKAPAQQIADEHVETKAGTAPQVTADDLYSRVIKYIPAPLVGLYLAAVNLIVTAADPSEVLLWLVFAFFLALTAAYLLLRKVRRPEQIAMSSLAFVAFAMASPGPFQTIGGWDPVFGALALVAALALFVVLPVRPLDEVGAEPAKVPLARA